MKYVTTQALIIKRRFTVGVGKQVAKMPLAWQSRRPGAPVLQF